MVSFRKIAAAAIVLAIPAIAQSTPAQVVENLGLITDKSQALIPKAASVNLVNGPLIAVGLGPFPDIIRGFADIVSTGSNALSQMSGMSPVPAGPKSDAIFEAFRQFVLVHQALLNILIGKAGLFETAPFVGVPIASALRQIESVVDTLAFALIDSVQSRATDIKREADSLNLTVGQAIQAYSGAQPFKRALPISRVRRAEVAAA